ncbi:protease inhibitor I42 family protein (plasmid) [Haloimpatiens sp. FM7330]|uniref:protease inhibitor I42 family protein n=1 Tax=Haloimpatiens sp. FM7330 TaxID=3298610 RepID=UPI003643D2E3
MNSKKNIIIIITVILLCVILLLYKVIFSRQVFFDQINSKLVNYNFKIFNLNKMDALLGKQRYVYAGNVNKNYIAIITYKDRNALIKQYAVDKNGTLNLTVPKEYNFIISLHANKTITYTWNIENDINNKIIKLEKQSWIDIPIPRSKRGKKGISYDRQNFYFKPLKSGNEKIIMRYEHQTLSGRPYDEITFNIQIK